MSGCKACGKPCEGDFCSKSCESLHNNFGVHYAERGEKTEKAVVRTRNISSRVDLTRRVAGERALEDSLPWHLHEGESWHCFSWGDVDALTYLRHVVREQRVEYAAVSTFAMAAADAHEIEDWIAAGYVGRVDFYVSENFQGTYKAELGLLLDIAASCGGRVAVFPNHSKVMLAYGERYDACFESSANVNTNPRCEQMVITVSTELCDFYKGIFDGIEPRNTRQQPEGWEPWTRRT